MTIAPGATYAQTIPAGENAFAYVIEGEAAFGDNKAKKGQFAVFDRGGNAVHIANPGGSALEVLLIAGQPIGEPVARYGPFVMNSKEEVVKAVEDYRDGRMGEL